MDTRKVNIKFYKEQLQEIDKMARLHFMTRSEYIRRSVMAQLRLDWKNPPSGKIFETIGEAKEREAQAKLNGPLNYLTDL